MKNINIKAVSQISGINESTLRAWERRYAVIHPSRSEGGHRLYSMKDVEKLQILWALVQEGHQISRLSLMPLAELKKMQSQVTSVAPPLEKPADEKPLSLALEMLLSRLDRFDMAGIHDLLQSVRFELSPRELLISFFLPLMREIGGRVADKELNVAQEHLISSLVRDELGSLYQKVFPQETPRKKPLKTVLATREGDLHELSLLMAAIFCRLHGHETFYLGANMPAKDLAEACQEFRADILVLSLSALPSAREIISPSRFVQHLDRSLTLKTQFLLGGSAAKENISVPSNRKIIPFSSLQEMDSFLSKRGSV